jgi:hypothetical protein
MFNYRESDKVKVTIGETVYIGEIVEIEDKGFWLTEDQEIEEFISFEDLHDKTKNNKIAPYSGNEEILEDLRRAIESLPGGGAIARAEYERAYNLVLERMIKE